MKRVGKLKEVAILSCHESGYTFAGAGSCIGIC